MKKTISRLIAVVLLALLAGQATAGPGRGGGGGFGIFGRRQGGEGQERDFERRREFRRAMEEQQRAPELDREWDAEGKRRDAPRDAQPKRKYLTPEERRTLRRQIQDAGNDIYTPQK